MTDLWELFGHAEKVESALHGDLRPLVELLRSDEPLTKCVREYLADEIEREADKRFRSRKKSDLSVRRRDEHLFYLTFWAKIHVAVGRLGADAQDEQKRHAAIDAAQDDITDQAALNFLSERGHDLSEDDLKNALKRTPPTVFYPRGPKWRMKQIKRKLRSE